MRNVVEQLKLYFGHHPVIGVLMGVITCFTPIDLSAVTGSGSANSFIDESTPYIKYIVAVVSLIIVLLTLWQKLDERFTMVMDSVKTKKESDPLATLTMVERFFVPTEAHIKMLQGICALGVSACAFILKYEPAAPKVVIYISAVCMFLGGFLAQFTIAKKDG